MSCGQECDNEDSVIDTANGCGVLGTDVGYTGHVQDNTGLVYAQQRYYDPQIGRFLSTDPVLPHADDPRYFGRYHYAANNPYRYTDPTGENIVSGFFESVAQGWDALTGGSFDGGAVKDALVDGYDGERGALGFAGALAEDVATVAGGWVINGAIRGAGVAARAVNAGRNVDRVSDVAKSGKPNALQDALSKAKPTDDHPNQLMHELEDGTRGLFRKDFGEQAHKLGGPLQGKGKVDHYNIQIQNSKGKTIEYLHVVPDGKGGFVRWGKDGVVKSD